MTDTPHTHRENRVKIVRFEARMLVDILNWWRNPPGWLGLPVCDEIPADAEVVSVTTDWYSRMIGVMIYHPSFDVVPSGELPPFVPPTGCLMQGLRVVAPIQLEHGRGD